MSLFNLERFRFDKKAATTANKGQDSGSKSPESEKENKPGNEQMWRIASGAGGQMCQACCR